MCFSALTFGAPLSGNKTLMPPRQATTVGDGITIQSYGPISWDAA